MQGRKGMYVLSLEEKKSTPLQWGTLLDAELDGAKIERIQDGWAGPGDERVTFAGYTKAKDGIGRQRIYSCKFDGSDVKAHTPSTNEPVPPYKFPGSEKTAIDVAKEWALGEIAWDDRRVRLGLE